MGSPGLRSKLQGFEDVPWHAVSRLSRHGERRGACKRESAAQMLVLVHWPQSDVVADT